MPGLPGIIGLNRVLLATATPIPIRNSESLLKAWQGTVQLYFAKLIYPSSWSLSVFLFFSFPLYFFAFLVVYLDSLRYSLPTADSKIIVVCSTSTLILLLSQDNEPTGIINIVSGVSSLRYAL